MKTHMKTPTQKQKILGLLEIGPLTPILALHYVKCFRLAARINELRNEGHKINTEFVKDARTGKTFASYRLEP